MKGPPLEEERYGKGRCLHIFKASTSIRQFMYNDTQIILKTNKEVT